MRSTTTQHHRQLLLALLTVIGFAVPNAFVVRYFADNGVSVTSVRQFFTEWTSSTPTSALTADLGITSVAFLLWSRWDSRDRHVRNWWLIPVGTSTVGICFSAPLYLILRELAIGHKSDAA
ncbi:hypothetical protein BJF84_15660 [Rhodococcus sp. CUA-806]|nr:hypothetical protein BJF84_26090 [Rhodococcus sp. CUA-806]OLT34991.1 hypothetical protein BJF84_15660 [Rhodococcus sp. CUA-806]